MKFIAFLRLCHFHLAALAKGHLDDPDAVLAVIENKKVIDASLTAANMGIHPGMSIMLAKRRCPNLLWVDYNSDKCTDLYDRVWRVFAYMTPLVEPTKMHEGYLDLSGCIPRDQTIEGLMRNAAWRLRFEFGICLEWGCGHDKWIATLACGENRGISPEEEAGFLRTAPVITLGLPEEICAKLRRYGIRTVVALLSTPQSFLQSHLQLPANALLPYLQRGNSKVRSLFPPPILEVTEDIDGEGTESVVRAIDVIAQNAAKLLKQHFQLCRHLNVTLTTRVQRITEEIKLAKTTDSAVVIARILDDTLRAKNFRDLRQIKLTLWNLIPAPQHQGELWQSRMDAETRADSLEKARQQLDQKFGHQTIQTVSQYAVQVLPRFAQLIYARRGLYLP